MLEPQYWTDEGPRIGGSTANGRHTGLSTREELIRCITVLTEMFETLSIDKCGECTIKTGEETLALSPGCVVSSWPLSPGLILCLAPSNLTSVRRTSTRENGISFYRFELRLHQVFESNSIVATKRPYLHDVALSNLNPSILRLISSRPRFCDCGGIPFDFLSAAGSCF